jgi:uncharacterized protein YbbC (DUF1343 family)
MIDGKRDAEDTIMANHVRTGLDVVARDGLRLPGRGRAGLLCNNAVCDASLRGAPEIVLGLSGVKLARVFSPQHGFAGEKQDNMVESGDGVHPGTGVPLVSLYGRVREPEPGMLEGLDALLIDLPDVGTRVYTFLATALLCLRACARAGLPVIVLDRPNPIGGDAVEGPVLRPEFASFVGLIPIPQRHGLSAGEYCRFGAQALGLDLDLSVVPCDGWQRNMLFPATGLPWVMPSPNLPTFEAALVYPGMVMLEGTNLSEGRGTTRPFELWGAPWLDPVRIPAALRRGPGYLLREVAFQPTFHKYAGDVVRGFQLHPTDAAAFRPVATAVALLAAVRRTHPDRFAWSDPPYEYEYDRLPIDLIAGTDAVRLAVDKGTGAEAIVGSWRAEEEAFRTARRPFLLYGAGAA